MKTPALPSPITVISELELITCFERKSALELVIVEVAPLLFRLEVQLAFYTGRSTLRGARAPRQYRSLDTLVRHLKVLGADGIVTRLELLMPL